MTDSFPQNNPGGMNFQGQEQQQSFSPQNQQQPQQNPQMNEYLSSVKENRSAHGNFLDNALTFDPNKERKSIMNVVNETELYNPWGKPGGGAPKMDQTGSVKTKIVGTLRWNLNGETEGERIEKHQNTVAGLSNRNTLMYKKGGMGGEPGTPRGQLGGQGLINDQVRESTTYSMNFHEPNTLNGGNGPPAGLQQQPLQQQHMTSDQNQHQQQQPPPQMLGGGMPQQSSQQSFQTPLEQEAMLRKSGGGGGPFMSNSTNSMSQNSFNTGGAGGASMLTPRRITHVELNRVSNKLYNDNQPTRDFPNDPFWFGRTGNMQRGGGGGAPGGGLVGGNPGGPIGQTSPQANQQVPFADARRIKLLDALENRPHVSQQQQQMMQMQQMAAQNPNQH